MEWITEPSAGAEPMCNNCFFYAHGSCSTKCSSQECSIRFWRVEHAVRRAQTVQRYFGQQRLRGDMALQYGGEPTLPITPYNCHVVPFY